jgi:hypothetical protein
VEAGKPTVAGTGGEEPEEAGRLGIERAKHRTSTKAEARKHTTGRRRKQTKKKLYSRRGGLRAMHATNS